MNELWLSLRRRNARPNLLNESRQVRLQVLGSLKRRKMTALNERVSGYGCEWEPRFSPAGDP
jgi:hypothetical protein